MYQYTENGVTKDGMSIPLAGGNRHYKQFIQDCKEQGLSFDDDGLPIPDESFLLAYVPPPAPPVSYSPYQFWQRFTKQERKDIRVAAKQNDDLEDWIDMLRVVDNVVVTDPNTVGGMQALVDAGLLTATRRDEILS